MRKSPVKLCAITIGASPRPDLWDEIAQNLSFPFEVIHKGLLDDPQNIPSLLVHKTGSDALVTQLKNGGTVWISSSKAHQALSRLVPHILHNEKPDALVILCTAIQNLEVDSKNLVLSPGLMIRETIVNQGKNPMGIILPDKGQWPSLDPELSNEEAILYDLMPPGRDDDFKRAGVFLKDKGARSVALHCMAYPLSDITYLSPVFGDAVAHPRKLIIEALNNRFNV